MFIIRNLASVSILYFLYGLAFLFLGASIVLKDMKASQLKISSSLWLLSFFGFAHGFHEWIELFLLTHKLQFSYAEIYGIKTLALFIVGLSFLFLLLFGLSLIFSIKKRQYINWLKFLAIILFVFTLLCFFIFESDYHHLNFFKVANNVLRKTFGFVGSLVTSYGLILYSRQIRKISIPISRYFLFAGVGFYLYGIFAGLIQSHVKIPPFSIPVEFFRGICAVLITYFLFKALNIFDIYTRIKLEQQIKNQAQSEKIMSLGLLSAGVAHEINSPLTNASLNMQMLRSQFDIQLGDGKIKKRLDAIDRNIDRASIIAKELLQFSQTQEMKLFPMDVNQILDNALVQVNDKLRSDKFGMIKISVEQEELSEVELSAAKLEQVFLNVINNSIEAVVNSGELFIKTKQMKGRINILISDDGTGISKENLVKVFDPFFTTKEMNKGTGLGLSICHSIIEQHGGTITLKNNRRGGVDANITLPVP